MIVSNWKMNGTKADIELWIKEVSNKIEHKTKVNCVICPPSCYLDSTRNFITKINSPVQLGSQEIDSTHQGALTGGINGQMLNDFSTEFVLIGHSEQRHYLNEDSFSLRAKLDSAINSGISVIFCIGEPSEVYSNGDTKNFLTNQLDILNPEDLANITIAYEPIWAIGTGLSAKTSYIEDIHGFIKNHLKKILNNKKVSVVYGGSVKLDNAEEILSSASVDGLLIGGASLDSETFSKIYNLS